MKKRDMWSLSEIVAILIRIEEKMDKLLEKIEKESNKK